MKIIDAIALFLGYLTIASVVILLAGFVGTLVVDAVKPWRKPTPNSGPISTTPVVRAPFVGRWLPEASPHPLKHPAVHVDAKSDDEAWKAIGGTAA